MLPRLVEKLKEAGVDQKYFQPIISKRKKILDIFLLQIIFYP